MEGEVKGFLVGNGGRGYKVCGGEWRKRLGFVVGSVRRERFGAT